MAEFPDLIRDVFHSSGSERQAEQRAGLYTLSFCKNGMWQTVRIDDYVPCAAGAEGGPVYSRGNGAELWVMLLEKAYAKVSPSFLHRLTSSQLHGSYQALSMGWAYEAMMDMTGSSSSSPPLPSSSSFSTHRSTLPVYPILFP
jgi:calpain-15